MRWQSQLHKLTQGHQATSTWLFKPISGNVTVFAPNLTMSDEWVSADEGPPEAPQQKGIWTAPQKTVIRGFAEEWNAEAADRKAILPTIVAALLALPEPPKVQNMGSVRLQ